MANTVSSIGYANTFGDWVTTTNNLVKENNDFAANNYTKPTGTLFLNEPTLGLQVLADAVVQGQLQVTGIGSSAYVQNNMNVGNQLYLTNSTISLVASGQANIGGLLLASGSGTGLLVANTANVGAQLNVTGATRLSNTLTVAGKTQVNNELTVTGNTHIANTIYVDGTTYIANSATVTGNVNVLSSVNVSNEVNADNTNTVYNTHTNTLDVTNGIAADKLVANTSIKTSTLQANTSVNTANLSVTNTVYTKDVQANTSVNTVTINASGTSYTDKVQANTSVNTGTISISGTTYTDKVQSNTSVNTGTISITGTAYADKLQANTSANTGNLSVTGTTYTNKLNANTSLTVPSANISTLLDGNTAAAYFNTIQTQGQLSVGGNFVISGTTVYNTNTFTLSAASNNQISYINVYRSGSNASIRWNEPSGYWDILDVGTGGTYSKILTANLISDSVTSTSVNNIASSNAANILNNTIVTANTNMKSYVDGANTSMKSYVDAANTSMKSYVDTANTSLKSYVDTANTSMKSYVDTTVSTANTSMKGYVDTANTSMKSYVDTITTTQVAPAFTRANTMSNTFIGTTGSVTPTNSIISFTSNNGVTIVATSANNLAVSTSQDLRTTASPTFAGMTLTAPLGQAYGGTGATSQSGALTALLPTGTTAGYVLTTGGPGNFYWAASSGGGGGGATPGTSINSTRLSYTANGAAGLAGNTFTTPSFTTGTQVRVYWDGARQFESEYSLNQGANTITFTTTPPSGTAILVEVDGYYVNPYYANNITFTAPFGDIVSSANTIQLAIQDLETRKAPLASPAFTGVATATTVSANASNTAVATTAFVKNVLNSGNTFTLNAATVTNGVVTTGSYADPSWITSLANTKISGVLTGSQLASTAVTTGTYGGTTQHAVFTVDQQGRITSAANATPSIANTQITGTLTNAQLSGGITYDKISSLSSSLVTTALGFTPYNATNPNGYVTSSGSVTNATNATNVTNALGNSQSYQQPGRSMNTTYTNSTGKPIWVSVCWDAPRQSPVYLYVDGNLAMYSNQDTYPRPIVCGVVPNGSTYYVSGGSSGPAYWIELR